MTQMITYDHPYLVLVQNIMQPQWHAKIMGINAKGRWGPVGKLEATPPDEGMHSVLPRWLNSSTPTPKRELRSSLHGLTNKFFLTFISELKVQAHMNSPWKSEQCFIWQVFGLLQQHCSSQETIEWFMPVPLFMALRHLLTQLTCEPQSSGNSLTLSRHKPLWARAERQWQKIRGTPEEVQCLDGWLFRIHFSPCTINPQVPTLFNNCIKEKETAWRETTKPELGLGDRRKPPPCNANAQFLMTLHRAQSS